MRIVIAPDSFKGCLKALEAAQAMRRGALEVYPDGGIDMIPMADGGEGTVEAVLCAVSGEKVEVKTLDPFGRPIKAFYGLIDSGLTAVIEMAAASGLTLLQSEEKNPRLTSTWGTGLLIKDALDHGVKKILLGIGGSATNDGGAGLAAALGAKFLDAQGQELAQGGAALSALRKIDLSNLDRRLAAVKIDVACDVQNPLCGSQGASAVYGPQKGATSDDIRVLDAALQNYGGYLSSLSGKDLLQLPGGGAAGGLGAGLVGLLGANLRPGSQMILECAKAAEKIMCADLVLTGEGKTDFQTVYGKVPVGVAAIAKRYGVPVLAVSGAIEGPAGLLSDFGIEGCFSIAEGPGTLEEALMRAEERLERAVFNILTVWKLGAEFARKNWQDDNMTFI